MSIRSLLLMFLSLLFYSCSESEDEPLPENSEVLDSGAPLQQPDQNRSQNLSGVSPEQKEVTAAAASLGFISIAGENSDQDHVISNLIFIDSLAGGSAGVSKCREFHARSV